MTTEQERRGLMAGFREVVYGFSSRNFRYKVPPPPILPRPKVPCFNYPLKSLIKGEPLGGYRTGQGYRVIIFCSLMLRLRTCSVV